MEVNNVRREKEQAVTEDNWTVETEKVELKRK